jgi:syntaxin 18
LSKQLHSITAHFDNLRAVHFQDAIDKRIPKCHLGPKLLPPPEPVTTLQADDSTYSRDWLTHQDSQLEVLEARQELIHDETHAL